MSPEPTDDGAEAEAPDEVVVSFGEPDIMLMALAALAQHGQELSLTVTVPGGIVTGTIVGRTSWLESFVRDLSGAGSATLGTALKDLVEKRFPLEGADAADPYQYGYLHMKDARFLAASGFAPSQQGFLWRGRLSEISSWSLGSLSR